MTYITDIQELRKIERASESRKRVESLGESIDEFLARGGAIQYIPPGVCSETIIIPVKQPDGQYKNDHHARGNSRHRQQEKIKSTKRKSGE